MVNAVQNFGHLIGARMAAAATGEHIKGPGDSFRTMFVHFQPCPSSSDIGTRS